MYNDSKVISASEINRFIYCPYQWYYERKYGKKYISSVKVKEKKRAKPAKKRAQTTFDNFKRGREFHDNYLKNARIKHAKQAWAFAFKLAVVLIIIIAVIILLT